MSESALSRTRAIKEDPGAAALGSFCVRPVEKWSLLDAEAYLLCGGVRCATTPSSPYIRKPARAGFGDDVGMADLATNARAGERRRIPQLWRGDRLAILLPAGAGACGASMLRWLHALFIACPMHPCTLAIDQRQRRQRLVAVWTPGRFHDGHKLQRLGEVRTFLHDSLQLSAWDNVSNASSIYSEIYLICIRAEAHVTNITPCHGRRRRRSWRFCLYRQMLLEGQDGAAGSSALADDSSGTCVNPLGLPCAFLKPVITFGIPAC